MLQRLFEEQKPLVWAGAVSFVLFLALAILTQFDNAEILGVNRWLKPIKFFISTAIFFWTMAVYLEYLPISKTRLRILSWSMIFLLKLELVIIAGQALRGKRSHYNVETSLDGFLFSIMGTAIGILTLIVIYIAYLYFTREIELPRSVVFGLQAGLLLFILTCFQGAYMAQHFSHAVGAPDGGPGLPIVNWATTSGDLRVSHFLGMHGLQAIPLGAIVFEMTIKRWSLIATTVLAAIYAGLFFAVFAQALLGWPFAAI